MPYQFAHERPDYADLASGRVLYSAAGRPAFPVRLASEVLQRCLALRARPGPVTLYDPCCGAAYHLSVLGFLHRPALAGLLASDIDPAAVALAARNLSLLSVSGLAQRQAELTALAEQYGKASHHAALASAARLQQQVAAFDAPLPTRAFAANALDPAALQAGLAGRVPDVVLADVPYGQASQWQAAGASAPLTQLLAALRPVIGPHTLIALASDKAQKAAHPAYARIGRFQIGVRRVTLWKLLE
jgi:hypothetical protein